MGSRPHAPYEEPLQLRYPLESQLLPHEQGHPFLCLHPFHQS